ncbi:hypothetical protein FNF27_08209 [Cafeteria roenbergensis]|uniref:Uncharacterized protein n=1 Tax=Cafeteria roenbergensis TaxID=33653 RepID=A0A5A8D670_CAFRO|nr:hypothetical protein FNF27_08209 [Cafeteria roenbergensis]
MGGPASGHTALSLAAKNKRRDIVIALLRAGASLKQEAAAGKSVERWIKDSFGEDEAWRLLKHALLAPALEAATATAARDRESAAATLRRLTERIAAVEATAEAI